MDVGSERLDPCLLPLRTFTEIDTAVTGENVTTCLSLYLTLHQCLWKAAGKVRLLRGPYRRYNAYQIEKLCDLMIEEGNTAKEAALMADINIRTAQYYVKK